MPRRRATTTRSSAPSRHRGSRFKLVSAEISRLLDNVRSLIYIDPRTLEYLIAAKIAGGHVILADSHGVGKTSLKARALAQSIEWIGPSSDRQAGRADEFAQADLSAENVPIESFSRIQRTDNHATHLRGERHARSTCCRRTSSASPATSSAPAP